jgi:hypothetical protein
MDKKKALIGTVIAILIMSVAAWGMGWFRGTDPAIAELRQLGDQMWDKNLPEAQRDQLRQDFRQRMESMSDDQRRAFFDSNRDQWQQRAQQRMDEYFAMSKADQQKRLDEIINQMMKPRTNGPPGANGQNGGRGGNGANRGPGGPGGRNMTEAQREERSKRRLDQTSPKMRAQFAEFRRQLDDRAQKRGIDPSKLQGWWPGGGRRRS